MRYADAVPRVQQQSQELSGPRESSSSGSIGSPWSGRLRADASARDTTGAGTHVSRKGKEKVDQPFVPDVSAGHSFVDGDSSGSKQSLDEELGIPAVVTPGVRRNMTTQRAPRCTQVY